MQARQPEDMWNPNACAFATGSLVKLGRLGEAKALATRGLSRFHSQLVIEALLYQSTWSDQERALLEATMRQAGYPPCASEKDAASLSRRLPECVETKQVAEPIPR